MRSYIKPQARTFRQNALRMETSHFSTVLPRWLYTRPEGRLCTPRSLCLSLSLRTAHFAARYSTFCPSPFPFSTAQAVQEDITEKGQCRISSFSRLNMIRDKTTQCRGKKIKKDAAYKNKSDQDSCPNLWVRRECWTTETGCGQIQLWNLSRK